MLRPQRPDRCRRSVSPTIEAAGVAGTRRHQIVRYDAEQRAQFKDVPTFLAKNGHTRLFADHRIALAGNGFDQGGFTAAVRPQHGHVFVCVYAEAKVVKDALSSASRITAHHADVLEVEQWSREFHAVERFHTTVSQVVAPANSSDFHKTAIFLQSLPAILASVALLTGRVFRMALGGSGLSFLLFLESRRRRSCDGRSRL